MKTLDDMIHKMYENIPKKELIDMLLEANKRILELESEVNELGDWIVNLEEEN